LFASVEEKISNIDKWGKKFKIILSCYDFASLLCSAASSADTSLELQHLAAVPTPNIAESEHSVFFFCPQQWFLPGKKKHFLTFSTHFPRKNTRLFIELRLTNTWISIKISYVFVVIASVAEWTSCFTPEPAFRVRFTEGEKCLNERIFRKSLSTSKKKKSSAFRLG